jgi:hypothetical protein
MYCIVGPKRLAEKGRNIQGPIFPLGPIWFGAETSCLPDNWKFCATESSVCLSQNLSRLLLINYWCNFIQTFQEWSLHVYIFLWFNEFCQSYGPLIEIWSMRISFDERTFLASWRLPLINAISMKLYRSDQ